MGKGVRVKVCVLHNPKSGSSHQLEVIRTALAQLHRVSRVEFRTGDDLGALAVAAVRDGFEVLAVAGGDGTVHKVLNGLAPGFSAINLAVLPLGTGNDFCRTLAVPLDAAEAVLVLRTGRVRSLDLMRAEGDFTGTVANAVTGGFSGRVATDVTSEMKGFWGPLAYLRGAAGPIAERQTYRVTLRLDGHSPKQLEVLNIVIANGRTAAGGVTVAPLANPEDGYLDIVIVPAADFTDYSVITARLLEGDYTADELVRHHRAKRVEFESDPPMPMSIDGELVTGSRFSFTIIPGAMKVYTGPGYHRHGRRSGDPEPGLKGPLKKLFGLLGAGLFLVTRVPGLYLTALLITLVCIIGFLFVADGVVGQRWPETNLAVRSAMLQYESPTLDSFAVAMHWAGHYVGTTVVGLLVVLVWLRRRRYLEAAMLIGVLIGCGILELVLKELFQIARPDLAIWFPRPASSSFPSGHALRSIGLYGYLAALLVGLGRPNPWRWGLAFVLVLLAFAIAASRVYLGVHTFLDVLAGGFAALVWVNCCLIARHYALQRRMRSSHAASTAVVG